MSNTLSLSFSPAVRTAHCVRLAALVWIFAAGAAHAQVTGIKPGNLPNAIVGKFYSATFTPVNPYKGQPVSWSITPGCLDGSGLSFSPSEGTSSTATIDGIAASRGTFVCVITATDAGDFSFSKTYTLDVVKACTPPQITSAIPPPASAGVPYSFTVAANGKPRQTFRALGLPPGLTIDPLTGVISGTPLAGGSYGVAIVVGGCGRSAVQSFTLVVAPPPAALSLSNQPNPAFFGQAISVVAEATGGSTVPTGEVLLCVLAPGQYCAAPVGAPPPGVDPSLVSPLLPATLDAGGKASFTLTGLLIQNYVLLAYYGGDAGHGPALAGPIDQFVIKGAMSPPRSLSIKALGPAAPIPTLSESALVLLSLAIAGIVAARLRGRARRG